MPRRNAPIQNATAAAPPPTASVITPECHQGRMGTTRLLTAPIPRNIRPVMAEATQKAFGKPATKGISGTKPHKRKAENVAPAACQPSAPRREVRIRPAASSSPSGPDRR